MGTSPGFRQDSCFLREPPVGYRLQRKLCAKVEDLFVQSRSNLIKAMIHKIIKVEIKVIKQLKKIK